MISGDAPGPPGNRLLSPADVRGLLAVHGVRPSRALGQNFLADPNTARRIVRLARVEPGDRVLEVGPGVGSLTLALADGVGPGGSVTALELDRHLVPVLHEVLAGRPNVRLEQGDALTVDYDKLLVDGTATMVSNLPYNVATPLIARLLEGAPGLTRLVVLVQREVAERLAAAPGTRECGAVSVKIAFFSRSQILAVVPPTVFVPRPRVDSALVAFDRLPAPPVEVPSPARLFELARTGFAQRRKMLRQALRPLLGPPAAEILVAAGVDPGARAEALSLEEWAALARVFGDTPNPGVVGEAP
ncbi:MAG: 16S rRNA (adenine(1518)-N(6)/adenine(1519)-N(6))-dimethyltransferase RsmA [Actinomycetota bacterium]|nr:16S rRNA (adenine(1518)-N(6)/adenine(1519)-N(6))-dimethyltransferase RsmA [Actinomycetota bacterium]